MGGKLNVINQGQLHPAKRKTGLTLKSRFIHS
jgi:hypothetical protein